MLHPWRRVCRGPARRESRLLRPLFQQVQQCQGRGVPAATGSNLLPPCCCLLRHAPPCRGTEFALWALGRRAGPFLSRGPMQVSASQPMGSSSLFCKGTRRRGINFHLLWFSTSDCIQPFGLLTPLPWPVPDKLMNFR